MPEPTKILIVGVGSIGQRHLRCFQRTGRATLGICTRNAELRQRVSAQYGITAVHADLESALAAGYDAAVICVPAHLHVPIALRLARAGVHLLIEKPLGTNLEGIAKLDAAIRHQKLVAAVAYVYRAQPALEAMKQALDAGRFGRPVEVVAVAGQHFPTYRPDYREIYYGDRATGGGAIQDALTHLVNAAEWLVGPADRVLADAAHQVLDGVEVEDTVHALARHGRVLASYALNQYQSPNEVTLTVVGDQGTCRLELHENRCRWMLLPGDAWQDEPFGPVDRDTVFVRQAHAFLDTLEGKRPPLCSLEEAIQTLRVNLALLASAERGTWEAVGGSG